MRLVSGEPARGIEEIDEALDTWRALAAAPGAQRDRIERGETGRESETGARDQYQHYEVRFAGGEGAGVAGKEGAARSREAAIRDGILA